MGSKEDVEKEWSPQRMWRGQWSASGDEENVCVWMYTHMRTNLLTVLVAVMQCTNARCCEWDPKCMLEYADLAQSERRTLCELVGTLNV